MTPLRKLVLPKSVALIEKGPPRVLLFEGKRYVEQPKADPQHQSVFYAGDSRHDGELWEQGLKGLAEAEDRREKLQAAGGDVNPSVLASVEVIELANLRSERGQLSARVQELELNNANLVSVNASLTSRVAELESENVQLGAGPAQVELSSLRTRAEVAERNVGLMERALGLSGLPRASVFPPLPKPPPSESVEELSEKFTKARTPERQAEVLTEFEEAVKSGSLKPTK